MLLGLAVKWFSSCPDGEQLKTPTELEELQKNRWLFKIRAEIEKDHEVRLLAVLSSFELDMSTALNIRTLCVFCLISLSGEELLPRLLFSGQWSYFKYSISFVFLVRVNWRGPSAIWSSFPTKQRWSYWVKSNQATKEKSVERLSI